jgi:hypothetical protein
VTPGKSWRFLVEWVVLSIFGFLVAAMLSFWLLPLLGIWNGPAIGTSLALFGMAAGQRPVLRGQFASSRWWLLYSAGGSAAAAVAGIIGSQFSSWPSAADFTGMFFLQLLLVSTAQWLRLRHNVGSAFLWPLSNVAIGTATWFLMSVMGSTMLGPWASVLLLAYPLFSGITMWWLLQNNAK